MAGLLQVLYGNADGSFQKPKVLNGSDGNPLLLPRGKGEGDITDRICTRPFACDLDGDGQLDLVVGNFTGTFAWFRGTGKGAFAPEATWLTNGDQPLRVDSHGDPFLVDWDKDGDLDLVSGSAQGGVFLFANEGTAKQPKFGKKQTLLVAAGHAGPNETKQFGDAHLKGPSADTRVWVDDVDGDGKLDLLVGDQVTLLHLVEGVDAATATAKLAAWEKKLSDLLKEQTTQQEAAEATEKKSEGEKGEKKVVALTTSADFSKRYEAIEKERDSFAKQETTGFIWLLRGK